MEHTAVKNAEYRRYHLFACLGVFLGSCYPLYMGVKVLADMLLNGSVLKENYPKYIIPYTPICVALLAGVLLMPVCRKYWKRYALLGGSILSIGVFLAAELLLEKTVVVTTGEAVSTLEDWQMFMCYVPAGGWGTVTYKTQTPIEILMGEYHPAFKLHFYLISMVLVVAVSNCLYGFGKMILDKDRTRCRVLVLQSVATGLFLGLCILACFTAFWRDGSLAVSPLSAVLMALFFLLFGMVGGIYGGSFLLHRGKRIAIGIPAVLAAVLTALMYVGELILLNGHVYILGKGILFEGLSGLVLAPVDLLIILGAGGLTALVLACTAGRDGAGCSC